MEQLKTKLASNLAPKHFLAYSLSFMGYGCVITGLGPLIPYLAALTGNPETQYAYLFFCRSIGFLVGAVILRLLQQKFTFHTIMIASSMILLGLQIIFCFVLDLTNQGIIMFFISAFCCSLEISVNICVLETQKHGDLEFWMLVCHGVFGVGGLIGPILVYIFEIYSFAVMGLLIALVSPYYWILKTPENHNKVEQAVSKQGLLQQIKNTGHEGVVPVLKHKPQRKTIGRQIQILVSFMFLIYIALESSYGSWIASYSVLEGIATKEEATKYSSIFWISMTIFRFASACVSLKPMKKLFMLGYLFVFFSLITIFMLFADYKAFACVFSAVLFGMCYSSMFPLLLAIPNEYNLEITAGQGANFMIWSALGEGVLSTLTGYLMRWFSNDMLFYSMFTCGVIFLVSTHLLKGFYEKQVLEEQKSGPQIELKEVIRKEK